MPHNFKITGLKAEVRWGDYAVAATLGAWSVEGNTGAWAATATITSIDTYRASQHPLVFAATHAKGVWLWKILTLQIAGATLTASLGPLEDSQHGQVH